jgi:hypothetical protein
MKQTGLNLVEESKEESQKEVNRGGGYDKEIAKRTNCMSHNVSK